MAWIFEFKELRNPFMTIRIVTDSTCDLPDEIISDLGITVVPMYINFGDEGYLDGVEITRKEFYERLPESDPFPTTGTPGLDAFKDAYNRLASEGASEVLSIHVSESLSAVMDVARTAAGETDSIPVTVLDSDQLSLGLGFLVRAAAQAAEDGASMQELLTMLKELSARTHVIAALDTLEFLKRSGRMNRFMAGMGSLLQIKPLLWMNKGVPKAERVRTRERAQGRLIEIAESLAPFDEIALVHTNAPAEIERLYQKTRYLFPESERPLSVNVTPVLGAHLGPGVVGFSLISQAKE